MELDGLEGAELEIREWESLGTSRTLLSLLDLVFYSLYRHAELPPSNPLGFDICIECHDAAPLPSKDHLRMVEERVDGMEQAWQSREKSGSAPRPPPTAANIIHLLFPSSPAATPSVVKEVATIVNWIGGLVGK